jgi:hypothetical protein
MPRGNLKNFGKGLRTNTFKERPQDAGRPHGSKSLVTMLKKQLFNGEQTIDIKDAEVLDEDGEPTGQKVDVRVSMVSSEALILHYVKRALKSDIILKDAINRIDGMPKQSISHEGAETNIVIGHDVIRADEIDLKKKKKK